MPKPRQFNTQPEIDPTWVQFALDHNVKFEEALVPLNRRASTSHSTTLNRDVVIDIIPRRMSIVTIEQDETAWRDRVRGVIAFMVCACL